jgi:hypothetical protein
VFETNYTVYTHKERRGNLTLAFPSLSVVIFYRVGNGCVLDQKTAAVECMLQSILDCSPLPKKFLYIAAPLIAY